MIDNIALKLADYICKDVTEKDVEGSGITVSDVHALYMYRIQKNIRNYGMLITALVILTTISGIKAAAIGSIFMISFAVLRKYWGGLHIESPDLCFTLSITIVLIAVYIAYIVHIPFIYKSIAVVSSTLLLNISGVKDHVNTPYTEIEKKELKKYGNFVLLTIILVLYGTRGFGLVSNILTLAVVSETVIILLTKRTYVR